MRLSTKSRFAVTAMIDIGLREHLGPVSLAAISQRHNISISYLEQIFKSMRERGLVDSTRGPGGGYTLNRLAHQISVADIIHAVHSSEEELNASDEGKQHGFVSTEELWNSLNQKMDDHMRGISLHSLISVQQSKGETVQELSSPKRGVFVQKQKPAVPNKVPNSVFALGGVLANGH